MKQPKKDHWVRRVGNRCKPSLRMLPSVIGRPASDVWPSRRTPPRANNGTTITLKFAAVSSEPATVLTQIYDVAETTPPEDFGPVVRGNVTQAISLELLQ